MSSVFSISPQGLGYSHFLSFSRPHQLDAIVKFRKRLYLSPWAKIAKTKGTLFPSTFKVWENKVPLVFSILAQWLRCSFHLYWRISPCWHGWQKMNKWLYLSPWAKIEKTKGTLLSLTLKVGGNKVPLVFTIFAQGLRYSLFSYFLSTTSTRCHHQI